MKYTRVPEPPVGPVVQPGKHTNAQNGRRPHTAKVVGSNPSRPTTISCQPARKNNGKVTSIDTSLFDLLKATIALFVIVDPLGPVPIFAGLTKPMSLEEKRKVFRTAAVIGAVLLAVFALVGQEVLLLFGISLQSFQIAGGLVLLLLSIEIIFRGERFDKLALVSAEETAVFPIAFPLLVGPGAITMTLISIQTFGITVAL